MTQLEKAQEIEIKKLEEQNKLMRELNYVDGFFKMYFKKCATSKTNKIAFEELNELYHSLFGCYRYQDFISFKNIMNYYHKKTKK